MYADKDREVLMSKSTNKPGQGRPKPDIPRKMLSIRLPIDIIDSIPGNKTQFIETAIKTKLLEIAK